MGSENFMDKLRMFFGLRTEPPRNEFRNPIWGSDDEDDGDELYTRTNLDSFDVDIHQEITKQMQDVFKSFGGLFGDIRTFFHDENFQALHGALDDPPASEHFDSNSIRDFYLKPGYHSHKHEEPKDVDLDGKISSQEISGLLKKKDEGHSMTSIKPFNGMLVPGRSFCQTIITTSITKPDGSIETRKIIKKGDEVIEETTTSSTPDRLPSNTSLDTIAATGIILSELATLFKNFY